MWTCVALVAALCGATRALSCLGFSSNVTTVPYGDIAVRYNDPLEILCVVEPPYSSRQARFVQRVYSGGREDLDKFTQVVNETALRLYVPRPQRQTSSIECELRAAGAAPKSCLNKVVVDTPPGDVLDFRCRSYNLARLVCRWRTPAHYVHTEYHLQLDVYGSAVNACAPAHSGDDYTCVLQANTKASVYRTQSEYLLFILTSVSKLFGNNTQHFTVNHFANLVPGRPTNLVKTNRTAHSIVLKWRIPQDIADFSKGVHTRINYQIKTVDNLTTWRSADTSLLLTNNSKYYSYYLKDLPYAHWSYDVRIFIKSVLAPDEEEFWSNFTATTFTTESERPPHPPRTELGAFESCKRKAVRDITIYWQQIDEFYESGNNFTYTIKVQDGEESRTVPSNKSSSVQFSASLGAVNVTIASANECGESIDKSYLYIPAHSQLLLQPTSFTKTVYGNKTYDLRWHRPDMSFDSYTVYWCANTDVKSCSGKLHFTRLGADKRKHRVLVDQEDKTYTFAISANRGTLSSGMIWATCNLPAVNATNKVAVFTRDSFTSRSVKLKWDLGCSFSEGHVKGYNLSYCPRADPSHCNSADERFKVINNPQNKTAVISDLMPHTTYTFHIAVIYKDGLGYNSDSVDATTLEDIPSEPLNIQISQVTNNSMRVSWDPPELKNGVLREYKIVYFINGNESTVNEKKVDVVISAPQLKDKRQETDLTGLLAFTNYTVRVKACTVDCSVGVLAGQVRTAIGPPSRIEGVRIEDSNLQWKFPSIPGGTLDLCQVEIRDTDNTPLKTINSSSLEIRDIPQCDLSDEEHSILYYYVRAVNYDEEKDHGVKALYGNVDTYREEPEARPGREYLGEWSEPAVLSCSKSSSVVVFWILGLFMSVALFIMLAFGLRKGLEKYKEMKPFPPTLPPHLGPKTEDLKGNQLDRTWSISTQKNENQVPTGDQDLLLPRRFPNSNKDCTSSSDSTDSTTLSLTSKEALEHEVAISDETSDGSSLHKHTVSAAEPPPAPPALGSGYVPNCTQDHFAHDNYSTSSAESFEPGPQPGYVQTGLALKAGTVAAPASSQPELSAGYVQNVAANSPRFAPPSHLTKPQIPNPLAPKLLPGMWKLPPQSVEPQIGLDVRKLTASARPPAATEPSNGYVSHTSSVINKHLNIVSNNPLGEEPAMVHPDMPPEAYSRLGCDTNPSAMSNLHSLQRDQRPASPH